MRVPATLIFWCFLVSTASVLLSLGGCGSSGSKTSPAQPADSRKIQHVVVIFQENRTPDNLFHGLPNADIASSGVNSLGQKIPLTAVSLVTDYDLGHGHDAFLRMYDNGKMDGADKISVYCLTAASGCPPPDAQFRYVNPSEVAPYFQLAERYTFADRMFQTNQGPSYPAHQFIISGTSAPTATSDLFAAENPHMIAPNGGTGCTSPAGTFVRMIDPTGSEATTQYPCFEHQTLADLLDAKGITWRYYTPGPGSIWTGPNSIKHLRMGPDWNNVILDQKQVLSDISSGHLTPVSWVIPSGQASDHPGATDGTGPSWVASIVNAIGNSPYWSDTAIFITWDDWGGWYDHVPPPSIINSYEYGFRVPLIVVSPYAKRAYVSHVTHDFGSILRFIEEIFGLPSLGYADARADDLSDCFDFSQAITPYQAVQAEHDANYFLMDRTPPTDPDDD